MSEPFYRQKKNSFTVWQSVRAVTNTLAPSFGKDGTKTIEDLKRQMVRMEEENIKLFSEKI